MNKEGNSILVSAHEMQDRLTNILLNTGFKKEKAETLARAFTENSLDGIYTHGINRFSRFVEYTRKGFVKQDAEPSLKFKNLGLEQWDGNLGPGILNAIASTDQSMKLAEEYGIGCVALSNTNHWMRGGAYGWQAAKAGYAFVGFTNTIANMPAHGSTSSRLGNNPLVVGLPYNDSAIVLDMAMSQFSFGSMELTALKDEMLPAFGGYNKEGSLTKDPKAIMESGRPLPVGYWKGAGLSLLLDLLAAILSGGLSTHEISKRKIEYGLSQVFISINIKSLSNHSSIQALVNNIINDYKQSVPESKETSILYPGERVLKNRKRNSENGIPVLRSVWEQILSLTA
ncbi:MAG TPA: 3-dehydro-L-gulonate 2-dehydrogenase [Chitinophagaceae bacterium]|nr:3-dehydro-L-gulonate 2-dehydrogenase [Chitinophagaceae bacterium]